MRMVCAALVAAVAVGACSAAQACPGEDGRPYGESAWQDKIDKQFMLEQARSAMVARVLGAGLISAQSSGRASNDELRLQKTSFAKPAQEVSKSAETKAVYQYSSPQYEDVQRAIGN